MKDKITLAFGIFFIILGIVMLLPQLFDIQINIVKWWPIILTLVGVLFLFTYYYIESRPIGLLFTGSLLIFLSIIFFYSTFEGWHLWKHIGPLPLFALALAFYITYLLDKNHYQGLFVTAVVLGGISLLSLFIQSMVFNETLYFGIALIISGVLLPFYALIESRKKKEEKPEKKEPAKTDKGKKKEKGKK